MNGYKESLRQYFSVQVKALRKKRKLTQEEMSVTYHGSGLWRFRARLQLLFCNRSLILFTDAGAR